MNQQNRQDAFFKFLKNTHFNKKTDRMNDQLDFFPPHPDGKWNGKYENIPPNSIFLKHFHFHTKEAPRKVLFSSFLGALY